jgi:hypothetical protein
MHEHSPRALTDRATCAVQTLSNAAGARLITISDAHAVRSKLNERRQAGARPDRHGDATGNFSITTVQAAPQSKHSRRHVMRHIKRLTERKARKWLCMQHWMTDSWYWNTTQAKTHITG